MIINISYRKDNGEYGIGRYSYLCELPEIAVGDIVVAPTTHGSRPAKVVEIDVPESRVDERVLPLLKEITDYCEEDAENE